MKILVFDDKEFEALKDIIDKYDGEYHKEADEFFDIIIKKEQKTKNK